MALVVGTVEELDVELERQIMFLMTEVEYTDEMCHSVDRCVCVCMYVMSCKMRESVYVRVCERERDVCERCVETRFWREFENVSGARAMRMLGFMFM